MRITLLIELSRVDDAAIILETLGFVADGAAPVEVSEGLVRIAGDLPEKKLSELQAIDGVRDWHIPPVEEGATDRWPWSQMPETD